MLPMALTVSKALTLPKAPTLSRALTLPEALTLPKALTLSQGDYAPRGAGAPQAGPLEIHYYSVVSVISVVFALYLDRSKTVQKFKNAFVNM
jgi:hypothetical protein